MTITSHFTLGTEDMLKNPDLALDAEGKGQFFAMHQIVVPDLQAVNKDGKNLVQRWADMESAFQKSSGRKQQRFAFY